VRDAACSTAQTVAESLPPATYQNEYAEMVIRLSTKEWFTARISAASLIASAYPKLTNEQQRQLMTIFSKLCKDDTPMVRRVAAQYLGLMVRNVVTSSGRSSLAKDGAASTLLIPLYEDLASNEQPVRTTSESNLHFVYNHILFLMHVPVVLKGFCAIANHRELCCLWSNYGLIGQGRTAQ